MTAENGTFDKHRLTAKRALTAARLELGQTRAGEDFTLTRDDPAVFGLLVLEVRNGLLAIPLFEISDGLLRWFLAQTTMTVPSGKLGEPLMCRDWESVLGLIEA